jgi:hypothetical protein
LDLASTLPKPDFDQLKKPCIVFNIKVTATTHPQQILRRIAARGRGWALTPHDFTDLGDDRSIGMALTRLVRSGKIRRIGHGLYDQPCLHPLLGQVGAGTDSVVNAIARKRNLRLLPSPALAANQLGLSTQVPARLVYHTDGAPTRLTLGKLQIDLRRNTGRLLGLAGRSSGLVAQALRDVDKDKVTPEHLRRVRAHLTVPARQQLLQDLPPVPAWMRPHFRQIASNDD